MSSVLRASLKIRLTSTSGSGARATMNWPFTSVRTVRHRLSVMLPIGEEDYLVSWRDQRTGSWVGKTSTVRIRNDGRQVHVVSATVPEAIMAVFADLSGSGRE